jgi:DNA invertase Pin-like site-specific DNA recombinase
MPRRAKGPLASNRVFGPLAAVGYVRVSTEEQATGGVSLDLQEERLRAYCVMAGLDLLEIVREEGVSGAKPLAERPAGSQLLQLVGPNRARHVVALKLDRVFRSAIDALQMTQRWDSAGVALHLVDMGGQAMNTASAMGKMLLTMLAGLAEFERNLIAERTTTAMRHMKARRRAYSPTPLGYVRDGDDLVAVADEQATVRRIQQLHTLGWNYSRIARQLTLDRVPTKNGGTWWPATVRYILRNDLHADLLEQTV